MGCRNRIGIGIFIISNTRNKMEAFNEVDEPLNPYSRLFFLFWAIVMVVVAGFRTGNKDDLTTKSSHVNTCVEAGMLLHGMKALTASTPEQIYLAE